MIRALLLSAILVSTVAHADSAVPAAEPPMASNLLARVARRVEALAPSHPQLAGFTAARAVVGKNRLLWDHGVSQVPNPSYAREMEKRRANEKSGRPVMMQEPAKTVARFDPKEGIHFQIELTPGYVFVQRAMSPYGHVGKTLVEVWLDGAQTKSTLALRAALYQILDEEIRRSPNSRVEHH